MRFSRTVLFLLALGVVVLAPSLALPAAAEAPAPEPSVATAPTPTGDAPTNDAPATGGLCLTPSPQEQGLGDPIPPATCTATCTEGPNQTVTCSGGCQAYDQNCAIGRQGFAQCYGSSPQYCEPCPGCTPIYEWCPEGQSCQDDDDCCSEFGDGFCVGGECTCEW